MSAHADDDEDQLDAVVIPAAQLVHAEEPDAEAYVPNPQPEHADDDVAPEMADELPAGQLRHDAAPSAAE